MNLEAVFRTLIDPETLREHLADGRWRIIDCRFDLADASAGLRAWRESHIPGAVYAHLENDLCEPASAVSGRHPLPDPDRLAGIFGNWGIGADTQVIAYDAGGGAMAARLWWLLRWLGHEAVAVLDGGWQAWRAEGFLLETEPSPPPHASFPRRPPLTLPVSSEEVLHAVQGGGLEMIDARAAARFRGDEEPIDPVAGHIPGARNLPFAGNLDQHGRFLSPARLRERFSVAVGSPETIVHYCGSGVTACHNNLAMEHADLPGSRLYAGSWSEWIRDPSRPVQKGQ